MSASNTTTISSVGAPNRRNTELALLIFAVAVPVLAYANVGLAKNGSVPAGMFGYGLGLGGIAGVAHLVVRKFAPYADPLMLPISTLLNGLGLVLIYRLDLEPSITTPQLGGPRAPGQLMWSGMAVALFIGVLIFLKDHRVLQRYTYISGVVALVLLIAPMFFPSVNGSKLWIIIPGLGSIQPGEFAKIILAVFFSGYLMVKRDALALASRRFMGLYLPRGRDLGPILVIWALSMMILVVETDLGSTLLYFGLFVVMLYVATERTSWIIFGLLLAAGGATVVGSTSAHVQVARPAVAQPVRRHRHQGRHRGGPGDVVVRLRRRARLRARPGLLPADRRHRRQERLHPGHRRRGAGAGRADGRPAAVRAAGRARRPYRAGGPRPVRQAAGDRALQRDGAPGLRGRGRRDRPDPADRYDDAVPRPGRLLRGGQLGAGGGPDADQRHRPPPGAAPAPSTDSEPTQVVRL